MIILKHHQFSIDIKYKKHQLIISVSIQKEIYDQYTYTLIIIIFFFTFSSQSIRISGNSINFDDKKIQKSDFYKKIYIFNINDVDVNNILVSKKEKYGKHNSFQHFMGYNDNNVIKPLYLELQQMTGYITIKSGKKLKNQWEQTLTPNLIMVMMKNI